MGVSATSKTYTITQDTVLNAGTDAQTPTLGAPPVDPPEVPVDPGFLVENYSIDKTITALPSPIATGNMSGAGYDSVTDRFFFVQNNTSTAWEVTLEENQDITVHREIDFNHSSGFQDTESIELLTDKDTVAVASENNTTYVITIHDWTRGDTNLSLSGYKQRLTLADKPVGSNNNSGLEGIAYNPDLEANGVIYGAGEGEQVNTDKRLFRAILPALDNVDYTFNDAEFTVDEVLNFNDRWEAAIGAYDLSGLAMAPNGHLLILSHQAKKIYQVDVEDLFTNRNGAGQSAEAIIIVSEFALPDSAQYEGIALDSNNKLIIIAEPNTYTTFTYPNLVAPVINALPVVQDITLGSTFTYSPSLASGSDSFWFKEYGPDNMTVDQETGAISWDTTGLPRGQGIPFAIGANNSVGEDIKWSAIHVDNIGTSKGRILGTYQDDLAITLSSYIVQAASEINGGDTLVIPGGSYPVSVTADESYENGYDVNSPSYPAGISSQQTTIMGENPVDVIIDGAAHDGIPRAKKAIQLVDGNHGEWVKFANIECRGVLRQGFLNGVNYCTAELVTCGDGGYELIATNYTEAANGDASKAAMYMGGDHTLIDSCFAYGQFRYGLQMGNPCEFNVMTRSLVRGDDYHGDQPRGLFAMYNTKNSGQYNCWGLDADHEEFSPFYKNPPGIFTYPATGNVAYPEFLQADGLGAINCQLAMGVHDAQNATVATYTNIVGYDTTNQIAPQSGTTISLLFTSRDRADFSNMSFGKVDAQGVNYGSPATAGGWRSGSSSRAVNIQDSIFSEIGWNGSSTVNFGDLFTTTNGATASTVDNCNVYDFVGSLASYGYLGNVTNTITTNPHSNGWDYPPRIEEGSPLATAGIGADITNFKNPKYAMQGDTNWDTPTSYPCWPMPVEKTFAAKARGYSKTGITTRASTTGGVDFGTGNLDGNRGGSLVTESYSEYIWGQFGRTVPPLRTSIKQTGSGEVTIRIGKYRSNRGDTITKFNIYNKNDLTTAISSISGSVLKKVITGVSVGSHTFIVRAVDPTKISAYDANETGESGNSYDLTVTVV